MSLICPRSRSHYVRSKAEEAKAYRLRNDGSPRDISPTLLNLLSLGLPKEMTGGDLRVPITAK
jgi:bisphosphoglycerate-independent phosphoglycerate mutase (AlkP superfamily)